VVAMSVINMRAMRAVIPVMPAAVSRMVGSLVYRYFS